MAYRILHVITGLGRGGAETMLHRLLAAADTERFESAVISLVEIGSVGQQMVEAGVPVYSVGLDRGSISVSALHRLRRLVRRLRPDLIQGWMYHGNVAALAGRAAAGVTTPLLWNIRHSAYDLRAEKRLTAALTRASALASRWPRKIIYNSSISAAQHEALGFLPEKTEVIPNGFDCSQFNPSPQTRAALRRKLGVDDAPVIGLVARYHPIKGHEHFLAAAASLRCTHPTVRYVVVGRGVTEPGSGLASRIDELGLGDVVLLLDEQADVRSVLHAFDIACSASLSEGFPSAIGEAMAAGIPCVVTDAGDSAHLVGQTGVVVPRGSPELLAKAIAELVDAGPVRRAELGRAARHRIESLFSITSVADRYHELYEEVIATDLMRRSARFGA